jgi:hypothetical protein
VAAGLSLFDRQGGIEQQNAAVGPGCEAAMGWHCGPDVGGHFLEDVAQRRRQTDPGRTENEKPIA